MQALKTHNFHHVADAMGLQWWFHRSMSITRLVSLCCLMLFASATAAVVLLPEVPAAAFGWHLPDPPFGALLFALACALVLLPRRASGRSTRPEPFSD
ncbi:hypothetical protein [Pseudorhodoferax sp. Leaf265]|jgi:hypothetical protein|uniref:hypothetical protein n=2 Tax=unclassified Pseudorhodoferax TaxID=2638544 RepID=UPI0012E83A8B|nr:hypothetical protein [Pseudorhodoferax sp. Leaf265]